MNNNLSKTPFRLRHIKPNDSITKGEKEDNYRLRMLNSLANKQRLNQEYLDKLVTLLHTSKKEKNYILKRNNIENTVFKYNSNNTFNLTLDDYFKDNQKNKRDVIPNSKTFLTTFIPKQSEIIKLNRNNKNCLYYNINNLNLSSKNFNLNDSYCTNDTIDEKSEISTIEKAKQMLEEYENDIIPLEEQKKIYSQINKKISNKKNLFFKENLPYIKTSYMNSPDVRNRETQNFYLKPSVERRNLSEIPELKSIYQNAEIWTQLSKSRNIPKNFFRLNNKVIPKSNSNFDRKINIERWDCKGDIKLEIMKSETDNLMKKSRDVQEYVKNAILEMDKYFKRKQSNDKNNTINSFEKLIMQKKNKAKDSK